MTQQAQPSAFSMPMNMDSLRSRNNFEDIQKWIIDIAEGKDRLYHQWIGEELVKVTKEVGEGAQKKTVIVYEWLAEPGAKAWMTKEGAKSLRVMLDSFISRDTLLANNTEFNARSVALEFYNSIVSLISDNYKSWQIVSDMRSPIITQLRIFSWMAMTRTIGAGNDRSFFKNLEQMINRIYKSPEPAKTSLLGNVPFLGGGNNG